MYQIALVLFILDATFDHTVQEGWMDDYNIVIVNNSYLYIKPKDKEKPLLQK